MSNWQEKSIAELAREGIRGVAGGPFGSSLGRKDYVDSGVPVVRGAQLASGARFSTEGLVFVSEKKAEKHQGNLARPGDVLVTQRGTLGQVGLVPKDLPWDKLLLSQSQMKITPAPEEADAEFLYYALSAPETKQRLIDRASAAGVPHINLETLRDFRIRVPPVEHQRRIAATLSSFDRLIETNRQRSAILRRLAAWIYRDWFVRFRFPGHQDHQMTDSAAGPVPAGWETCAIKDVASVIRGRSYRRSELTDAEGIPFLTLKCVEREGGFRLDGVKRYSGRFKDEQRAASGDILIAVTDMTQERRIVARAFRMPDLGEPFAIPSLDLALVKPLDSQMRAYLYAAIRFSAFGDRLQHFANGANVLHLGIEHIEQYEILLPPAHIVQKFGSFLEPILAEGELLETWNRTLATGQALLLPRLISGQLDIDNFDFPMFAKKR